MYDQNGKVTSAATATGATNGHLPQNITGRMGERNMKILTLPSENSDGWPKPESIAPELRALLAGESPAMRQVLTQITRVAPTSASVLITGESGTGKEVAAEAIHQLSPRRDRPFLPINCGAIPSQLIESELFGHEKGSFTGATREHCGYFERAHGGTLFLDEITEMAPELQVSLLRVLETSTFAKVGGTRLQKTDVRIIAASNRHPMQAVEEGHLREDLLYRIQVFPLHLPPLREREGDIELLARHFLAQYNLQENQNKHFSRAANEALNRYSWPGNLRELKNVVLRSCIMAESRISLRDLPGDVRFPGTRGPKRDWSVPVGASLAEMEKKLILATLDHYDGRRDRAARMLGICPKTLYNRLREYEGHE